MRGSVLTLLIGIGLLLVLAFAGCGSYNGFVTKDENVANAWSKVESAYQRRADLIPNLVETVKGVANFEQETFTKIVEARSKATGIQLDPSKLTPENLQMFQEAQGGLSSALSRLMVVVENYPELKANQNFSELQAQLEGTENRIKVERDKFNDVVTDYNKAIRTFPSNIFAGMFGFGKKGLFEADKGAENAPKVDFKNK